jgi:hypothetical protein
MSFGDRRVHERLGERVYERARNDPRFQAILVRGFVTSYAFDVPYLGGYSRNGATVYVDRDTPAAVQSGRKVFAVRPRGLVQGILIHEHWEKTAIDAWRFDYDAAHELATHAEHHFVREKFGMEPDEYEALWRPIIHMAEQKLAKPDVMLPPDLDPTPYRAAH